MVAEGAITGTLDQCRQRLKDYSAAGIEEVALSIKSVSGTRESVLQSLEELAPCAVGDTPIQDLPAKEQGAN